MKPIYIICFFLLCFGLKTNGQNLVPNPSFELHTNCTNPYLWNAMEWCAVNTTAGVSAYYNSCQTDLLYSVPTQTYDACFNSFQIAHSGIAYTDIASFVMSSNQQSIIPQVKLLDTLEAGKTYCVTYYVSVFNNSKYTIDKLGALLTATPFPCFSAGGPTVAIAGNYAPQILSTPGVAVGDTLNWEEISGTFTAIGNEAYLALGDFFIHSQHLVQPTYPSNCNGLAYYYLDDVSVEEVFPAKVKNDTTIMFGDSTVLGNNLSDAAIYSWQPTTGLSCPTCANPNASPITPATYTVTKTQCKAVTTATIFVNVDNVGVNELNIDAVTFISPNPSNGILNVSSRFKMEKIEVISLTGQLLLTEFIQSENHQLKLDNLSEGIYFVKVIYPNGLRLTRKIIINR